MDLREQRRERDNLDCIIARLKLHATDDRVEIATIRSLWRTVEQCRLHQVVPAHTPRVITSGWAAWCRRIDGNRKVIFLLLLPGDVITPAIASGNNGCEVVALTRLRTIDAIDLTRSDSVGGWLTPGARAMIDAAEETYRGRLLDHMTWLSDRDGARNLASLLLELHDRSSDAGRCPGGRFDLPIGQRILAQAVGLSVVQVNKVIGRLRAEGLVSCERGWLRVDDCAGLRRFSNRNAPVQRRAPVHGTLCGASRERVPMTGCDDGLPRTNQGICGVCAA